MKNANLTYMNSISFSVFGYPNERTDHIYYPLLYSLGFIPFMR